MFNFTKSQKPAAYLAIVNSDKIMYVCFSKTDDVMQASNISRLNFIERKIFMWCMKKASGEENFKIKKFQIFGGKKPLNLSDIDDLPMDQMQ